MPEGDTIHHAARRLRPGRWSRSPRAAWLVLRRGEHEVVQFDGPVLELMTEGRTRLDQRIAGIGNLWKVEACFEAGIDPWRPAGQVSDAEAVAIVDAARPRMQQSARDGNQKRFRRIYNGAGRPCPRCGAASVIRSRGQGDGNRTTYWCPTCQS